MRDDSWNDSGILNTDTERTRHWLMTGSSRHVRGAIADTRRKTAQAADNATTDKSQHDYYDCTFTLNDRNEYECAQHHHWPVQIAGFPYESSTVN